VGSDVIRAVVAAIGVGVGGAGGANGEGQSVAAEGGLPIGGRRSERVAAVDLDAAGEAGAEVDGRGVVGSVDGVAVCSFGHEVVAGIADADGEIGASQVVGAAGNGYGGYAADALRISSGAERGSQRQKKDQAFEFHIVQSPARMLPAIQKLAGPG